MYPSDYGYATSGGSTTTRATCLNTELYNWNSNEECFNNNWLYNDSEYRWTLTPNALSEYMFTGAGADARDVFCVYYGGTVIGGGLVNFGGAPIASASLPSIYLKTNVKIESRSGSLDLPYNLKA